MCSQNPSMSFFLYQVYNIFLLLGRNGHQKFMYEGENNKNGLVGFMKNPSKPPDKPKEEDWSTVKSDVVHLTSENFDSVITVCISCPFHDLLKHWWLYYHLLYLTLKKVHFAPHSFLMVFCMIRRLNSDNFPQFGIGFCSEDIK